MNTRIMVAATLACLLLAAQPAQAIYIMTPLSATADKSLIEVGDTVTVTIGPNAENETSKAAWASKSVRIYYAYDTAEGQEGLDEPTSDETYQRIVIHETLALDDQTTGAFTWTAPPEVDDKNVALQVESLDGELLAIADIGVGDAPPRLMMATGAGGQEPARNDLEQGDDGAEPATPSEPAPVDAAGDESARSNVPAPGIVAILALAGIAALALRRRS